MGSTRAARTDGMTAATAAAISTRSAADARALHEANRGDR